MIVPKSRKPARRGVAATEMALLAPVLIYVNLIAIDFGRVYFYTDVLNNCARNGAIWASDSTEQAISPYTTVTQAALADATDLSIQPTISGPVSGTDGSGNKYVSVTASYTFKTILSYPGIPASTSLTRTVSVRVAPTYTY